MKVDNIPHFTNTVKAFFLLEKYDLLFDKNKKVLFEYHMGLSSR